jgi:hypothetical protein
VWVGAISSPGDSTSSDIALIARSVLDPSGTLRALAGALSGGLTDSAANSGDARPRSREQTSNFLFAAALRQVTQARRGFYGAQGQAMPETSEAIVVAEVRAKS